MSPESRPVLIRGSAWCAKTSCDPSGDQSKPVTWKSPSVTREASAVSVAAGSKGAV